MKKITLIIMLLPFFVFAQKGSPNNAKLPLIESICTDTIKGKYQETVFSYDHLNRLIQVMNRVGYLKNSADPIKSSWVIDTTGTQNYGYILAQMKPSVKKNISYKSNGKGSKKISGIETFYFIYDNGKRVMDSVVEEQKTSQGKTKLISYKTIYEQTDSTLSRVTDLSNRDYPNVYENNLDFHENIVAEKNAYNQGNPGAWSYYYTFTNFDNKINPLAQLNIATILLDERIQFSFPKSELINLNRDFDKEGTTINWHLNNQNNLLRSTIKRPDTDSDAADILSFSYTYNQFQLPVYCSIYIKKVSLGSGITSFRSGFLKHFSFRYKK